jgi:WD40 repeat protein
MKEKIYQDKLILLEKALETTQDGVAILNNNGEFLLIIYSSPIIFIISFGIVLSKDRDYMTRVDASAKPSAFMWHPQLPGDVEERFIVANDEFKFKEFNADSKQCRRITLTPTFGGPLTTLMPVKVGSSNSSRLYAYATANKIIGVGCLPLSGNPSEVIGIVAHPGAITSMCLSGDGKYLFSTGGSDLSCNMWKIDHNYWSLSKEVATMNYSYTNTIDDAYYTLLDGGKNGELHNDIIDYFYYCQIRAQGEDSMEPSDEQDDEEAEDGNR